MQIVQDIFIAILLGYLACTNAVADYLLMVFKQSDPTNTQSEVSLREMDSRYNNELIPRILLENSNYQRASIIDGILTPTDPATPLAALVNIFCTFTNREYIRSTTGSGFFIHPNGVLLTNAHVAQFLLLEDVFEGTSSCIIRTGTPAEPKYIAELLYIPPAWIQEHATLLTQSTPEGTGERDYALLYITDSISSEPLPAFFPAMSIDINDLTTRSIEQPVRAAGYPAKVLEREGLDAPLRGIEVGSYIAELLTFNKDTADLFTIAGTHIGEHGSSGGPVANQNGHAIGLISTRGDDENFGVGSLRALSLSYINRTLTEETGFGLHEHINGNLSFRATIFKETVVPFLQFMLRAQLRAF